MNTNSATVRREMKVGPSPLGDAKLDDAVTYASFMRTNRESCRGGDCSPSYGIEASVVFRALDDVTIDESLGEMGLTVSAHTVDDDASTVTSLDHGVRCVANVASTNVIE